MQNDDKDELPWISTNFIPTYQSIFCIVASISGYDYLDKTLPLRYFIILCMCTCTAIMEKIICFLWVQSLCPRYWTNKWGQKFIKWKTAGTLVVDLLMKKKGKWKKTWNSGGEAERVKLSTCCKKSWTKQLDSSQRKNCAVQEETKKLLSKTLEAEKEKGWLENASCFFAEWS